MREEGLSSIVTVEFIELPMSDTEAEMQTEFDAKECKYLPITDERENSLFGFSLNTKICLFYMPVLDYVLQAGK